MKEDFIMVKNSYGELYFMGPCNFIRMKLVVTVIAPGLIQFIQIL